VARLKSEIFVSAYLRRAMSEGATAMLRRRGHADAGAIYIKIDHLDGTASLYAPAPVGHDLAPGIDRQFIRILDRVPSPDVEQRMAKEINFDHDLWFLELEERGDRHFLDQI
jgi:hypothetical protein